jgi:hypothetical protein
VLIQARQFSSIAMDVMYSSGIGTPRAVQAVNPEPRPNPIIIAVERKEQTPRTAAPRRGNRLIGPEKHPFRACQSSWEEGLKRVSKPKQTKGYRRRTLVNVGQNTTLGDGDMTEQLVQLLIVPNGELKMTGNDTGLLVITSSVTGQFKDFGGEILKNSGEVDGST